jgi:signal transduction histidine kinase
MSLGEELDPRTASPVSGRDGRLARPLEDVASLEQLAGDLAHEFNNVLTAVLGHLDLAARTLPDGAPSKAMIAAAVRAAERGAVLTGRMLAFARGQEPAASFPALLAEPNPAAIEAKPAA